MAKDPYRYFRVEAREHAAQLAREARALEDAGGGQAADVARILRVAHTLKGAARVVKHAPIAETAHAIEGVLAPYRDRGGVPGAQIAALRAHADDLDAALGSLGAPGPEPDAETAASAPAARAEPLVPTVRADLAEVDTLLDGLAECRAMLDAHQRLLDRAALDAGAERALRQSIDQLGRELEQVRDTAEQLRLANASALFDPLDRTARDAARVMGNRVRLATAGGGVRLDVTVLDVVLPALVQLVRNAVAHGIEAPSVRVASGKPAEGRVTCSIAQRGQRVIFTVTDDGRGVDLAAVRAAARARGKLAPATEPTVDETVELLLRGGISTAASLTELAGRGVGMDLVRAAAERLGGTVRIRTAAGAGTVCELEAPLSLTATDALVVEAAGTVATLPLGAVRGALRIRDAELSRSERGASLVHGGEVIPFVHMARAFRAPAPAAAPAPAPARRWTAVVVEGGARRAAIGVDRIVGTANVVLRPLSRLAPADPLVAGASLDETGAPRLAVDPAGLVAMAHDAGSEPSPARGVRPPILVVDDSLTTRMLEKSILEAAGWEVELASSGEEGLAAARARPYALLLVDVEMPGIDGFRVVEEVRADPALAHLPVVLVTSRNAPEDLQRGRDAGANGYVIKSEFDQAALCALIEELVSA